MNDILFLEPIFKERIWGGSRLKTEFGYNIPDGHIGECWAISAHPHGDSKIINGQFSGLTLSKVFSEHKDLFNDYPSEQFPLLTKILDAHEDLSVQVHPDDHYAKKYHDDMGKNECWYIIDAEEGAYIIYGHTAQSKQEFKLMIENHTWDKLLIKKFVKKGDFIYVPAGTIHAIGKGILILETQQSSDTTFRLYDYDRKDDKGNLRDLHIESSIQVSTIPHHKVLFESREINIGPHMITELIKTRFFEVEKWHIDGVLVQSLDHFLLVSVLEGMGKINGLKINKGNHFILTSNVERIELEGKMDLIVSRP